MFMWHTKPKIRMDKMRLGKSKHPFNDAEQTKKGKFHLPQTLRFHSHLYVSFAWELFNDSRAFCWFDLELIAVFFQCVAKNSFIFIQVDFFQTFPFTLWSFFHHWSEFSQINDYNPRVTILNWKYAYTNEKI